MSKTASRIALFVVLLSLLVAFSVSAQDTTTLDVVGFVVPVEEQGTPVEYRHPTFIADF